MSTVSWIFLGLLFICLCYETSSSLCLRNEFRCSVSGACIPLHWRCDGTAQCRGGTDEVNCTSDYEGRCPGDSHRCPNSRCLPGEWACDGQPHCENGTDEHNCDKCENWGCAHGCKETPDGPQCYCRQGFALDPEDGRTCKWHKCKNWGCAHRCKDTSDGPQCYCHHGFTLDPEDGRTCKRHTCRNWGCSQRCKDTPDGPQCYCREDFALDPEDGRTCKLRCLRNEFRCLDGSQCVRSSFRCDGLPDCGDGSDEDDRLCADRRCPGGLGLKCDKGKCLPDEFACDGQLDCGDLTDEKDCPVPPDGSCMENQFLCLDHEGVPPEDGCIAIRWRCSVQQYRQCRGYELACAETPCNRAHARLCDNGTRCVRETKECDGHRDCDDGSDEEDCYKCEKWGCSEMCTKTSKFPQCHCKSGYELDAEDQRTCKPASAVQLSVQHDLLDGIPLS